MELTPPQQAQISAHEKWKKERSRSQQLRDVLFRYWEHDSNGYANFDEFYDWIMISWIEKVKRKINNF